MNIGTNIKNIRKEKKMTLQQIADIMGCSPQLISQYENGKRIPKIKTIEKIANALEVDFRTIAPNIPFEQYQTTNQYKRVLTEISALEGILAILQHIYGNIEDKSVYDEDNGEIPYFLIGKGENSFILYEEDVDKLFNYVVTMLPFMVNELKDTRPEQEVINELKTDLNSPETIAAVKKFLAEHEEAMSDPPQD